jgi:flagellum-specific ATP synthase
MTSLIDVEQFSVVRRFKSLYSRYQRNRDLITVGAYAAGTDTMLDRAIALQPQMEAFLQQNIGEKAGYSDSLAAMQAIVGGGTDQ